ncbi:1-aminocyclopropane-1-carboxylate oxidase homolog 3-like [Mangifera indica]|uniref:1-aminocyclopropane-1-carboxylate oxidase homolog 3-like n=1 Tax=Mangifera indica TaxID=29780 RepID=UPI001CF997EB|nr:1-aminocyclopropane-1-carboxylate oxidase homolog 3-like [Mangifera indica]
MIELESFKLLMTTKASVKGLVDAGILNVARIFIRPPSPNELVHRSNYHKNNLQVPHISLRQTRGGMIGVVKFNEQDVEVKKEWYTRDAKRQVTFNSNFDLYQPKAANWRDTITSPVFASENFDPRLLAAALRDAAMENAEQVRKLGDTI